MVEVDDRIAVEGDDGIVESQRADPAPVLERAPYPDGRPLRLPLIGHLDGERERPPGRWIAAVEDLRHDLVAKVEIGAGDPRLVRGDEQAHELGCARRAPFRLAELRDRIELTHGRLFVDPTEHEANRHEERRPGAATRNGDVGRIAQLRVVDEVGVGAADVLLRDEVGGSKRPGVVRIGCRKQFADQRQRSRVTAARLGAARRVTRDDERRAPLAEIARVLRRLGDSPPADQADAVGVDEAAKSFAVGAPSQIGAGIEGALAGLLKQVGRRERQNAPHDASERHLANRKRRLASRLPRRADTGSRTAHSRRRRSASRRNRGRRWSAFPGGPPQGMPWPVRLYPCGAEGQRNTARREHGPGSGQSGKGEHQRVQLLV